MKASRSLVTGRAMKGMVSLDNYILVGTGGGAGASFTLRNVMPRAENPLVTPEEFPPALVIAMRTFAGGVTVPIKTEARVWCNSLRILCCAGRSYMVCTRKI